jgi:hypothetical protein
MNHQEHELENDVNTAKECCGEGCCGEEVYLESGSKVAMILQWILLGWAFLFSLLTLIMLPKIIRKEIVSEQALKAGGIENYMKLNKEIYDAPEYKERMKQEVETFIQQSKAQMEMMKNQPQADANAQPEITPEQKAAIEAMMATGSTSGAKQ